MAITDKQREKFIDTLGNVIAETVAKSFDAEETAQLGSDVWIFVTRQLARASGLAADFADRAEAYEQMIAKHPENN